MLDRDSQHGDSGEQMKFQRHVKIFRGQLDVAAFVAVFFLDALLFHDGLAALFPGRDDASDSTSRRRIFRDGQPINYHGHQRKRPVPFRQSGRRRKRFENGTAQESCDRAKIGEGSLPCADSRQIRFV